MPRVAIIGTAGRKGPPLTAQLYERMHTEVERVITEVWGLKWDEVDLVSGGAAWSDHLAVMLFLSGQHLASEPRSLTLHLPCRWDSDASAFYDSGSDNWKGRKLHVSLHDLIGTRNAITTVAVGGK